MALSNLLKNSTTTEISFSKYAGCGNDFIIFDNRTLFFPSNHDQLIKNLCDRSKGIGADGVILLENSLSADFKMRIFNADGSEAEMCGNGIRCLLKYIRELGFTHQSYTIETMKSNRIVEFCYQDVRVEMGSPTDLIWNIPLPIENKTLVVHHLNTGVPHTILFVKDITLIPLDHLGPQIRYHPFFLPKGTNVNVASLSGSSEIHLRTYERGVEGETLACGTGATATALAAAKLYGLESPISVQTRSGESILISFYLQNEQFHSVKMSGNAIFQFRGKIDLGFYLKRTVHFQ